MAQFSASTSTGHCWPSDSCSLTILRLRLRDPPPQVVEHSDQGDHSDTRQSLGLASATRTRPTGTNDAYQPTVTITVMVAYDKKIQDHNFLFASGQLYQGKKEKRNPATANDTIKNSHFRFYRQLDIHEYNHSMVRVYQFYIPDLNDDNFLIQNSLSSHTYHNVFDILDFQQVVDIVGHH